MIMNEMDDFHAPNRKPWDAPRVDPPQAACPAPNRYGMFEGSGPGNRLHLLSGSKQ